MTEPSPPAVALVGAVSPLVAGAAHFNDALAAALGRRSRLTVVSWRRLYPPLLYRGPEHESKPAGDVFLLDWASPLTWRRAACSIEAAGAQAAILPWLHPVMGPPYLYLLRRLRGIRRVVICHNVMPHEPHAGARALTAAVLRRADLLVIHSPHQAAELESLGLGDRPRLELFHPRFVAEDFAPAPPAEEVARFRAGLGDPGLLLLCFGAVRAYKGFDLAVRAVGLLPPAERPALVIAGRFWKDADGYRALVAELGLGSRVTLIDRYVPNEEAALLFAAADAVLLPYREASQSGVAQLAFAYGKPVIATAVGGLPSVVVDGVDGILCAPDDVQALAGAIRRFAADPSGVAASAGARAEATSFDRYAELLLAAISA